MKPHEFEDAFPKVMSWIHRTLRSYQNIARPVGSMNFKRLPLYFSRTEIERAKFAAVDRIPLPPLASIGLRRFKKLERGDYDGITYLDTYFLKRPKARDESLHLHEMIHVVQWRLLGAEFFLAMYAAGLEKFGYRDSPLEKMAYDAQDMFARGERFDAERFVAAQLNRM